MNYKMMGRLISYILIVEAVFMLPALFISMYDKTGHVSLAYGLTILILLGLAGLLYFNGRRAQKGFYAKEGLVCVGLSWIVISFGGCLPFVISGEIPSIVDAMFEMVSGFTTTGASIIPAVEDIPRGLLYWRSFSHWLGGMGVLVFLLAVAPVSDNSEGFTVHLLRAESPGPSVSKLVPRMRDTAMLLYLLYIALTILNIVFLIIGKMPLFDALCTAFGTAGTGGFGIKNDSMASYSPYIQNVTTVFMLLFGVNFSLYHLLLLKRIRDVIRDDELRLYLAVVLSSALLIAYNIRGLYGSLGETFRHAFFQVATIITTTGFATTDFDKWPEFSKGIMLCLMVIGACAGSTGGGIKCSRVVILWRSAMRRIKQVLNPRRVEVVRVNREPLDEKLVSGTEGYLGIYCFIIVISFLIVSLDGFDITTNISAVITCFNNVGPGFAQVGPSCNFSIYSGLSKIVLTVCMLAGRLEIYPILVLLSAKTWKAE